MTNEQAKTLGKILCDNLPIREEVPGVICTNHGDKTHTGLGHMVNDIVTKIKKL